MNLKKCAYCQKKFKAKKPDIKCCSHECAGKAKRKGVKKNCLECGCEFWTRAERIQMTLHCTLQCRTLYYRKQIKKKECIICKTIFTPKMRGRSGGTVICSTECYDIFKKCFPCKTNPGEKKGAIAPPWKGKDANSLTQCQMMRKYIGQASSCMNLNCSHKSSFYKWVIVDYDADRKVENFAQLCISCLTYKGRHKIEPQWDNQALESLHAIMRKILSECKVEGL